MRHVDSRVLNKIVTSHLPGSVGTVCPWPQLRTKIIFSRSVACLSDVALHFLTQPRSAETNAVVKTMLTSLAQIQARVLEFAHQLEQEELYARLPVWLAIYQIQRGVKITGQLLPSYDNEHILAAAQGQAFAARRDYYLSIRGPYQPKPVWVREDYLLDAESEKKVSDDANFRNRQIISELEYQRWRVEQKI